MDTLRLLAWTDLTASRSNQSIWRQMTFSMIQRADGDSSLPCGVAASATGNANGPQL